MMWLCNFKVSWRNEIKICLRKRLKVNFLIKYLRAIWQRWNDKCRKLEWQLLWQLQRERLRIQRSRIKTRDQRQRSPSSNFSILKCPKSFLLAPSKNWKRLKRTQSASWYNVKYRKIRLNQMLNCMIIMNNCWYWCRDSSATIQI